jgi:glycosyltransferase involved in cell wall biosynthesis
MRILHCIYDHIRNPWVGGGGAVRVREIYRRLASRHEIMVLSGRYPGATGYREGNVAYEFTGTERNNYVASTLWYAVRGARYVKANAAAYDVVIEDFAPYNPIFSFLRRKDSVIQLHQREGFTLIKKHGLLGIPFYLTEKFYHRFFRNVLTISEMSKERYGLNEDAAVIPNGFDGALLSQRSEEEDFMLFLGRLHIGQKGLDTLRNALHTVACRLVIAGGGKDEVTVKTLFSDLVGSGRVFLAGFVNGQEKADLLRKCLFMVVPSRYEGQPLTVIEAAACGKPVIVSDIPELRYAVDAGFGASFRCGEAEDLAEKMRLLLNNPSLRQEMGRKAREYARQFTWDRIAGEYEQYLFSIAL